jgi:hypothetical protein
LAFVGNEDICFGNKEYWAIQNIAWAIQNIAWAIQNIAWAIQNIASEIASTFISGRGSPVSWQ